ncbi:GNAT family N-acetyltransferase [Apibacter raozihei]|uniref:GNAT family N-acetyltransferase n=1 Tax=Apibacter raozihei TaxID=2500547 RepID=UPI000FE4124A|nr:GNAT family N-acetyltransferase [Apibacter raozihei]
MIRKVRMSDAKRIAEIYNYYIEETIITFEEEKVSEKDIVYRIEKILKKNYPYLIYEENNDVIGYAYVNNWRERSAYDITLETSLYLDHHITGKGRGNLLLEELIEESKKINVHSLIGVISLPNEPSRKIHKRFGFELVGNFRESGKKFNRLIDVEFWQLILR